MSMHLVLLAVLWGAALASKDSKLETPCKNIVYHVQNLQQTCTKGGESECYSRVKDFKKAITSMKQEIKELQKTLNEVKAEAQNKYKSYHYMDEIAQAACIGIMSGEGWMFAVRRPCPSSITCNQICTNPALRKQDPRMSTRRMVCSDALHVYDDRPRLSRKSPAISDTQKLGLKVYKYNKCTWTGCGPNYCCCRVYP